MLKLEGKHRIILMLLGRKRLQRCCRGGSADSSCGHEQVLGKSDFCSLQSREGLAAVRAVRFSS
jgi:hypothetical protein